ncbi:class IV lanthionine synthetase LanL [Nocardia brasiliensis]
MADVHFGVFGRPSGTGGGASSLTDILYHALRRTGPAERWSIVDDDRFWCTARPVGGEGPAQGWKLHVSATPASASQVLERSLPVLLAADSAFKFALTVEHVAQLNTRNTPRGHSGKFITVYPTSDEEAVRLAAALHTVTASLPGPRILSDRPYVPDSLVHYRYGAFVGRRRISNDGMYSWLILDPAGNLVADRRIGQYLPPVWARCPFPEPALTPVPQGSMHGEGILLGGRFLVRDAIRHVNKGGVYRAVDTRTGAEAIIKEARPHVAADETGRDVRDLLRAEARALELLASSGRVPRVLGLFEQAGHLFLAEELIPGLVLHRWVLDHIRDGGWRRDVPGALEMAGRLALSMAVAHDADLILRDFTPGNIMVTPEGELRLIDLELAVVHGERERPAGGAGTPGYAAPEQLAGAPASIEADYHSLGAAICFVFTGSVPELLTEAPRPRLRRDRLAQWLDVRASADLPEVVLQLILGLMDPEPARRWTVSTACEVLAEAGRRPRTVRTVRTTNGSGPGVRLDEALWHETVDSLVTHLVDTMDPNGAELWPTPCAAASFDPCTVQIGASGILGVLARCFELTGDLRLAEVLAVAGRWLVEHVSIGEDRLDGLYFGRAGIAWALYEAGQAIGDDYLVTCGIDLATALPAASPNPDLTHGTAGIGMALLYLGRRLGHAGLLRRAEESADALVQSVEDSSDGLLWGTPTTFESRLAGQRYYGFAHGTAGVAAFLLATGRADCVDLARRAGEGLLTEVVLADDGALWGAGPADQTTAPYWCHGSAGIGGFLTRLHRVTGDDRFDKLAGMAARAVMANAGRATLGQCHGLAGNGEFLLDMAELHRDSHFESDAHTLARIILASRAYRDAHVVFPDERGEVSPSWAHGSSGILSFLLRLRYGSSRLWIAEPAFEERGDETFPHNHLPPR